MWRYTAAALMIGGLFGCVSLDTGPETGGVRPNWGKSNGPPSVPGVQGPYGEKVPMTAPYSMAPPSNPYMAKQMMSQNVPLNMVNMSPPGAGGPGGGLPGAGMPGMQMPPGGMMSPPGMPFAPGSRPPGANMSQTGFMPPGMGAGPANMPPGMGGSPDGLQQVQFAASGAASGIRFPAQRTQARFVRPTGMSIAWFTVGPDGTPGYSTNTFETPFKYNFAQGAIYRLKLSNIEARPGLVVYPTMEVVPCNPKVDAFLAHSSVPIEFTAEDFKQVIDGNYLVKVIYLPDPQFQDETGSGLGEIVSTRLEPGQDPIQEALRRGSILLVIRLGNVDQEAPNTPPLATPSPLMMPPQGGPQMPPNVQVPYMGASNSGQKMLPPMMGPNGMPMMPNAPGAMPRPGTASGAPFNLPSMPLAPNSGSLAIPPGAGSATVGPNFPPSLPPGLPGLPPSPGIETSPAPSFPGLNEANQVPGIPTSGSPALDNAPGLPSLR